MTAFPSKLAFASYLQYSPPRFKSHVAEMSRRITYAIKQDRFLPDLSKTQTVIAFMAERIKSRLAEYPFLEQYLGPEVLLVPSPRSSPLSPGALWPAARICEALVANGLGVGVDACLERFQPIDKAAFAKPGERPGPEEHFASVKVKPQQSLRVPPSSITLVDDVVTRGATFIGLMPRLQAKYPHATIRCFALVRTRAIRKSNRFGTASKAPSLSNTARCNVDREARSPPMARVHACAAMNRVNAPRFRYSGDRCLLAFVGLSSSGLAP